MDTAQRIRDFVAPLAIELGAEVYDVEYAGGVLRVTLDKPGGIDIATIGKVTRALSHHLDEVDPIPGEYNLEVSSPGLERPLRTADHFTRAVGETVKIKTVAHVAGDRRFNALVVSADPAGVTLRPEGSDADRTLAYSEIERARTVFEWGPAPKPGGPKKTRSADPKKSTNQKAERS